MQHLKNSLSLTYFLFFSLSIFQLKAQSTDYIESPKAWVQERIDHAKKGKKELIETPFAVRSSAWGCRCPDYYLAENTNVAEGPWVQPVHPEKLPKKDEKGHSLMVKGYFTGKIISIDLRYENKEPKEWLYEVPEFKIISWQHNKKG